MQELKHPYPSVDKDGRPSYGGNQGWSRSAVVRGCGCGAVAGTDVLLYLHRTRPECRSKAFQSIADTGSVPLPVYNGLLNRMRKRYFFVIPRFGMNGLAIVLGLNHYFRVNRIPIRARWGVWRRKLWKSVERMLGEDLPVICAVGPNFPFLWKKHKLNFYVKNRDGSFRSAAATKAHYVTITGIDDKWLRISSWGREYYISREEYTCYVKKYSSFLVSNIVDLRFTSK